MVIANTAAWFIFALGIGHKEAGRRQLFVVAHHDQRRATQHRAGSILGADLRCLIEDHQVEARGVGVEELAN